MGWIMIFSQFCSGLYSACFLFLTACGLTLAFGIGNFFNFAHGAFFMLGGYLSCSAAERLGVPIPVGVLLASIAVGMTAWALYWPLVRRLGGENAKFSQQLLSTYGILLMVSEIVRWIWGNGFLTQDIPDFLAKPLTSTSLSLSRYQLIVILATMLIGVCILVLIQFGRFGRLIRATIDDASMVAHLGVNTNRVIAVVFIAGAGLAGLGGAMAIPMVAMTPFSGDELIISALIVTIIGGRGNIVGAMFASFLISETVAFGNVLLPRVAPAIPYLVALVVLTVRPNGLFVPFVSEEEQRV